MKKEPVLISRQLKMIHNLFEERRNRQLNRYNLTSSQMDVLIYLSRCRCEGREVHQRELEKAFRLKNPTVTGLLNRLEEKGFIIRKTNKDDRRFRMIELTEKSNCMLAELCEEIGQIDERIYSCMTANERDQLTELLGRILNRLSELQ